MADILHTRVRSVDILRGIVMVIMALDHTRDFFTDFYNNPTDLSVATTGMFLTRWITHFCAPVFVFLAGTSAFLSLSKKQDKKAASYFLFTRGIWLIVLEFTVVRFGWLFNLDYSQIIVQVIWAIGWSMIFLAALIHLPFKWILAIGLIMIFSHNTLDFVPVDTESGTGLFWYFLHQSGFIQYGDGNSVFVIYPLIPWIGVMATGYCFGRVLQYNPHKRDKMLYRIGGAGILLFIVLRATNLYGDPHPWTGQDSWFRTVLSFINCEKYPPSLLYLLMTLGPSIMLMPMLERLGAHAGRFFTVFGRVPLFYYVTHIYLIHIMAIAGTVILGLPLNYFTDTANMWIPKAGWGWDLPVVYAVWIAAVLLLYYPSRWFMRVKQQNKQWWLSYL